MNKSNNTTLLRVYEMANSLGFQINVVGKCHVYIIKNDVKIYKHGYKRAYAYLYNEIRKTKIA